MKKEVGVRMIKGNFDQAIVQEIRGADKVVMGRRGEGMYQVEMTRKEQEGVKEKK